MRCVIIIVDVTKPGMHERMNDKSDDGFALALLPARLVSSYQISVRLIGTWRLRDRMLQIAQRMQTK